MTIQTLWTIDPRFTGKPEPTITLDANPFTRTSRPRTQWCKGCGFCVSGNTSAYLFKKAWDANHLAYHKANV